MLVRSEPQRLNDVELVVSFDSAKAIDKTEPSEAEAAEIKAYLDEVARRLVDALGRGLI